ncbi:MAG: hypothetical protein ABIX01_11925 [Chitinophagaceae bacterium]
MLVLISILKAVGAYFVLLFVGTNLIGLIVRSFLTKGGGITGIIFSLIAAGYLYCLYHFFNIGVATAGLVHMITRIPDLLFEIRTGEKVSNTNKPKGPLYITTSILSWLTLPLLWYSFYFL